MSARIQSLTGRIDFPDHAPYKSVRVAYTHPEGEVEKIKRPVMVTVVLVVCVIGIIVTGVIVAPLLGWAG